MNKELYNIIFDKMIKNVTLNYDNDTHIEAEIKNEMVGVKNAKYIYQDYILLMAIINNDWCLENEEHLKMIFMGDFSNNNFTSDEVVKMIKDSVVLKEFKSIYYKIRTGDDVKKMRNILLS